MIYNIGSFRSKHTQTAHLKRSSGNIPVADDSSVISVMVDCCFFSFLSSVSLSDRACNSCSICSSSDSSLSSFRIKLPKSRYYYHVELKHNSELVVADVQHNHVTVALFVLIFVHHKPAVLFCLEHKQ